MPSALTLPQSSDRDLIGHRAADFLRALDGANVWRRRFPREI